MDLNNMKAVVVASQIATIQAQIAVLTQLQTQTNVNYGTTITALQAQISALNAL